MISINRLSTDYPVWFCDIWGVVHNGREPFATTIHALTKHRKNGGRVILVSNSPRSSEGVVLQLNQIGIAPASYDAAVTSGDVTRDLMLRHADGKLYHLGAERDLSLFAGLDVERVPLEQAGAVICTGLVHDDRETPDDYGELLAAIKARDLTFICANPDKRVRKGNQLVWCAGALAENYEALGGKVLMAGKPFAPIYELARKHAAALAGKDAAILAIGDGPETDILGAANQNIPCLYVAGGVRDHVEDKPAELAEIKALVPHARIVAAVAELVWDGP
jgi:HAD superfamily hydrolase (TIGR01459 family)